MGVPRIFGLLLALIFTLSGSAHAQDDSDNLECYQFTWPGVYEYEAVNESQVVDTDDWCEGLTGQFQMKENTLPCYLPFIYTDPPSRPPNITELNRICSQQYCEKYKCAAPQKCIKWSEFDVTGNMVYYSSFCGTMSDNTDKSLAATEINNACWKDVNISYTAEACVCDTPLCNTGSYVMQPSWNLLPFLFALICVVYYK